MIELNIIILDAMRRDDPYRQITLDQQRINVDTCRLIHVDSMFSQQSLPDGMVGVFFCQADSDMCYHIYMIMHGNDP